METNNGKAFKSHPVLDGYPKGTTYIYRSPNLFGGRAAARLNTDILVFAEKSFPDKDAALKYLNDLDLIDIINQATGSIVLVTPSGAKAVFPQDTCGDGKAGSERWCCPTCLYIVSRCHTYVTNTLTMMEQLL